MLQFDNGYANGLKPVRIDDFVAQLLQSLDQDRFELVSAPSGPGPSTLIVIRPRIGGAATAFQEQLSSRRFHVAVREGNLRISPHLHNSGEEMIRLSKALE